ncbi:hypothetical protein PMAYCL1PPCAC_13948, partial [Pristionchus mayeri]
SLTVVRKGNGPVQRMSNVVMDPPKTPQCVLCEIYPKTSYAYASHLRVHHDSTLNKNGIYLMCVCGRR